MPPFFLIVVVVLVLAWRSEPTSSFELALEREFACVGDSRPVDEATLVRTLARYGVDLEREDLCFGMADEPTGMFTNIGGAKSEAPAAGIILLSQGHVWCELYGSDRFGDTMTRRRVEDEVVIRVLNVRCGIEESEAWQVERLADGMRQLTKAV